MVQGAITRGMTHFALTEHSPRADVDLYPEEDKHKLYKQGLFTTFDLYYTEATRLKQKYATQINILVGFETEWIRPESMTIFRQQLEGKEWDVFVGSVHHLHGIPIEYDADGREMYRKARAISGGEAEMRADYFDAQLDMLKAMQPPVVGHFDVIRLCDDKPDLDLTTIPEVWAKIERNLDYVVAYGGLLEINTSAWRKGLPKPYPRPEICRVCWSFEQDIRLLTSQALIQRGGRMTISDDSHCVDHIGTNYHRLLDYVAEIGLEQIHYYESNTSIPAPSTGLQRAAVKSISAHDLRTHPFWNREIV